MITAIVTFKIPAIMTRAQWFALIEPAAARFQNISGLIRKQFLFAIGLGGGVYLWETREAAEAFFQGPLRESIRRIALGDPEIRYFDTQVVVDNAVGAISKVA